MSVNGVYVWGGGGGGNGSGRYKCGVSTLDKAAEEKPALEDVGGCDGADVCVCVCMRARVEGGKGGCVDCAHWTRQRKRRSHLRT